MKVYGASCVQYVQTRDHGDIYLVGEIHNSINSLPCNFSDAIHSWQPQECWTELTANESHAAVASVQSKAGVSFTPLIHLAHQSGTKHQPYKVFPINVRREPPLHILESIFDYGVFMATHQTNTTSITPDTFIATKRLEKRFFKCMSHRRSALAFIKTLIVPELRLPSWYLKSLDEFEKAGIRVDTLNPIKEIMSKVSAETRIKIVAFALRHSANFIENETYSQALASASDTRRTNSPKYIDLRDYFISLFAILMDVYIIAKLSTASPATRVIVMGFNHMQRVFDFIVHNTHISGGWTAYSHSENYVDLAVQQPITNYRIHRDPHAELQSKESARPKLSKKLIIKLANQP